MDYQVRNDDDFFWYQDGLPIRHVSKIGFFSFFFFVSWIANFNSYAFSLAMVLIAVVARYRGRGETLLSCGWCGDAVCCVSDDHQLMLQQLI